MLDNVLEFRGADRTAPVVEQPPAEEPAPVKGKKGKGPKPRG